MEDKYKKMLGLGLGAVAIVGLGLALSQSKGTKPTPTPLVCPTGTHLNDAGTACVPDTINPPTDVGMSPAAIWERAKLVGKILTPNTFANKYSPFDTTNYYQKVVPAQLPKPEVSVTDFKFTADASPDALTRIKNYSYWFEQLSIRPDTVTIMTDYCQDFCVSDDFTTITYLDGSTKNVYVPREAGKEVGQLVRQGDGWNDQFAIYEWDGVAWQRRGSFMSNYLSERYVGFNGNNPTWYTSVGKADVTIMSAVDFVVPPDIISIIANLVDPRDGAVYYASIPSLGDASNRSSWLHLRANVPYTFHDLDVIAYSVPAWDNYSAPNHSVEDTPVHVAASAYSGGPLPKGTYAAAGGVSFPYICIMLYNEKWYDSAYTEADPYPWDVDLGNGYGKLTKYDAIASFSISQGECLSETLKFWHYVRYAWGPQRTLYPPDVSGCIANRVLSGVVRHHGGFGGYYPTYWKTTAFSVVI